MMSPPAMTMRPRVDQKNNLVFMGVWGVKSIKNTKESEEIQEIM